MYYRNDLCCKRKFAYDMEGAALKWGSHRADILYVCTHCGYLHFSGSNDSIMDRLHQRALLEDARRTSPIVVFRNPLPLEGRKPQKAVRKPQTRREAETRGQSKAASCRANVWSAARISIGDLLAAKIAEEQVRW